MTALRSLLARRAMGVGLLIVYAGALEIGTVDVEKPRKPGRSLQDAEDSTVSSRKSEAEMLINNPTMVCDDCPTIYGCGDSPAWHSLAKFPAILPCSTGPTSTQVPLTIAPFPRPAGLKKSSRSMEVSASSLAPGSME